jgi:GNAT superfamily N-acetyltransferase
VEVVLHRSGDRWDVAAFAAAAGAVLDADPVRHTLAQTVLDRVGRGSAEPELLLTVHRRGGLAGAVLRERGRSVLVSALPPGLAAAAARRAVEADPAPRGVAGPVPEAEAYAAAHAALTGAGVAVAMRQRLFRLVALCPPRGVAGACRLAGPADVDLLARWQTAFGAEAVRALGPPTDPRPGVVATMEEGYGHVLWERGGSVAYAVVRPPVAGMARIGPVYTPPELRGHGYGTAVTAAATAWALDAGAREVCLFTDLSNPVSNAIYPRIGYRPLLDACELTFLPGDEQPSSSARP